MALVLVAGAIATVMGSRAVAARAPSPGALELPAQLPSRRIVLPVLMYHRIDVPNARLSALTRKLTVHPADFERQMTWLKTRGFTALTQEEVYKALMHGRSLRRKPVVITFDDGYRNVFGKASPILARLGFHATAYVISSRISNGDPSFLTWPLLRSLERRGVAIGSHTVSHRDLTEVTDAELRAELVNSRRALEHRLGHRVQWLAYPFGAYDGRVVQAAGRAGYVVAVSTMPGACQESNHPLELRRIRVLDTTTMSDFKAMMGQGC